MADSAPNPTLSKPQLKKSWFRFSLRSLMLLITISAFAIYYWPRPQLPGEPNLVGQVTDANGRGIEGVTIKLWGGFATRWEIGSTKTDRYGYYHFDPSPIGGRIMGSSEKEGDEFSKGMVGITIQPPKGLCSSDGKSWWDEYLPMIKDFDFRKDFQLVPSGKAIGLYCDSNGEPIAGAALRICSPSTKNSQFLQYVETEKDGSFIADSLPAGSYEVDINSAGEYHKVLAKFTLAPNQEVKLNLVKEATGQTD